MNLKKYCLVSTATAFLMACGAEVMAATQVPSGPGTPARLKITLLPSNTPIKGLSFNVEQGEVTRASADPGAPILVSVRGLYPKGETQLIDLRSNKVITVSPDGKFSLTVRLPGPASILKFAAVDLRGATAKQAIRIDYADWDLLKSNRGNVNRLSFSGSLGVSSVGYTETSLPDVNFLSLTVKASARYRISVPNWDTELSLFFNALPFNKTPSDITVRFLGVNLRIGYVFPFIKDPWSLTLMGGLYYTQMFVSDQSLGYGALLYPQVYPVLRRSFGDDSIYIYFKYVPLSRDFLSFFQFSKREFSTGMGWVHPLGGSLALTTSLDYSSMKFDLTDTREAQQHSITGAFGLGW